MDDDLLTSKSVVAFTGGAIVIGSVLLLNGGFDTIGDIAILVLGGCLLALGLWGLCKYLRAI